MKYARGNILRSAAASGLLILALASAAPANAQIVPAECRSPANIAQACTLCHIAVMVINLTNFLMKNIAFPAAVLLIAIGGLTLLTAGPSEGRRTTGKKIITTTVIGLIIVLVAWLAVDTAIKVLTGTFNFGGPAGELIRAWGPWNKVTIPATGCPL